MDWNELERMFEELADALQYTRLDVQWGAAGEHFRLAGGADNHATARFLALVRLAGEKLAAGGGVGVAEVDLELNPVIKWYRALTELTGLMKYGHVGEQRGESGESLGFIYTGSVDRVADASATLCLQLIHNFDRAPSPEQSAMPDLRKVFVVHGRDHRLRRDFFTFLRALGLHPIEWVEAIALTGKGAPYIGEILDHAFASAQAVVVLLSPDDEVRLTSSLQGPDEPLDEREPRFQARPNVLFEAGLAFGRSPDRTILVQVGAVKPFSDIAGRHMIKLSNDLGRRQDIADRLRAAGCAVDTTGRDWHDVGNFSVVRAPQVTDQLEPAASPVKWVDLQYPADSGLVRELEAAGFEVKWCLDTKLARRLDLDGWSLVTIPDSSGQMVTLKVKDRPADQTLIKRPRTLDAAEQTDG